MIPGLDKAGSAGLPLPVSPYAVDKGALILDAGATQQGSSFHIFNQARNDAQLAADGYNLIKPNACTIVEGGGYLTMTGDGVQAYQYWGSPVINTAPTIYWAMDTLMAGRCVMLYANMETVSYSGGGAGGTLMLHTSASPVTGVWYQIFRIRNGTNSGWEISCYKSPNTVVYLNTSGGAQAGWAAFRITPTTIYVGFSNAALNAFDSVEPEVTDFTWVGRDSLIFGSHGVVLRPACYLVANLGRIITQRFGRVMFRLV